MSQNQGGYYDDKNAGDSTDDYIDEGTHYR